MRDCLFGLTVVLCLALALLCLHFREIAEFERGLADNRMQAAANATMGGE